MRVRTYHIVQHNLNDKSKNVGSYIKGERIFIITTTCLGYRQTLSFNAFFFGFTRNLTPTHTDRYMYNLYREQSCEVEKIVWAEIKGKPVDIFEGIPKVRCSSLWDFYKEIGYDYKKKKYLTGEKLNTEIRDAQRGL